MSFPYPPLRDIRVDVPPGRQTVGEQSEKPYSTRPLQSGDLESLLWNAYQRVALEKAAGQQAALSMLGPVTQLEVPQLSVSAETAKNQLLGMIGRMMRGYESPQNVGTTLADENLREAFVKDKRPESDIEAIATGPAEPIRGDSSDPNTLVVSRERAFADEEKKRHQCAFDAIRLLVLKPAIGFDDLVHCQLEPAYVRHHEEDLVVLDENPMGEDPVYEALSYTWGDLGVKRRIKMNDRLVEVSVNLESALRHLRKSAKPRTLWVDALCINQSDDAEKSIQVSRMSEIYAQAACVLVWLGPASRDSDLAMQCLHSLGTVENDMFVSDMYENQHMDKKLWLRPRDPLRLRDGGDISTQEKSALETLFRSRQWWTRRWIIQEIAYADRAYLVCGSLALDWDVLSNFIRLNETVGDAFTGCWWLQNPLVLDQQRQEAQAPFLSIGLRRRGTTLRSLISKYEDFECSNIRDRIYCLVGLPSFPPGRITVDYGKSPEEVLIEAAKVMIYDYDNEGGMRYPSLNIVCSAYRSTPSELDLPSWVADLSIPEFEFKWLYDLSETNEQTYHCSKNEPFLEDLSFPTTKILQCKATILDNFTLVCQNSTDSAQESSTDVYSAGQHVPRQAGRNSLRNWLLAIDRYLRDLEGGRGALLAAPGRSLWNTLDPTSMSEHPELPLADALLVYIAIMITQGSSASTESSSQTKLDDALTTLITTEFIDDTSVDPHTMEVPPEFTLGITQKGLFGLVPELTAASCHSQAKSTYGCDLSRSEGTDQSGADCLAILYGANVPVVLRKVARSCSTTTDTTIPYADLDADTTTTKEPDKYKVIGPALIHGIMQGQILGSLEEFGAKPEMIRLV